MHRFKDLKNAYEYLINVIYKKQINRKQLGDTKSRDLVVFLNWHKARGVGEKVIGLYE